MSIARKIVQPFIQITIPKRYFSTPIDKIPDYDLSVNPYLIYPQICYNTIPDYDLDANPHLIPPPTVQSVIPDYDLQANPHLIYKNPFITTIYNRNI